MKYAWIAVGVAVLVAALVMSLFWPSQRTTGSSSAAAFGRTFVGPDLDRLQDRVNRTNEGRLSFSDDVGFIFGENNKLPGGAVNGHVGRLLTGETMAQQACDAVMAECQGPVSEPARGAVWG